MLCGDGEDVQCADADDTVGDSVVQGYQQVEGARGFEDGSRRVADELEELTSTMSSGFGVIVLYDQTASRRLGRFSQPPLFSNGGGFGVFIWGLNDLSISDNPSAVRADVTAKREVCLVESMGARGEVAEGLIVKAFATHVAE